MAGWMDACRLKGRVEMIGVQEDTPLQDSFFSMDGKINGNDNE